MDRTAPHQSTLFDLGLTDEQVRAVMSEHGLLDTVYRQNPAWAFSALCVTVPGVDWDRSQIERILHGP